MPVYTFPVTKARTRRATAHFRRPWTCPRCGKVIHYSGGQQVTQHALACARKEPLK